MRLQIIFLPEDQPGEPLTSQEVPEAYLPLVLPYSDFYWTPGRYGGHLTQQIEGEHYTFSIYDFFVDTPVRLFPLSTSPFFSFLFVTEGNLSGHIQDFGPVNLLEGRNYLFYLPPGIRHVADFKAGHCRLMQFSSQTLFSGLAKDYPLLQSLLDKLEVHELRGTQEMEAPFTVRTWALLYDVLHFQSSQGHLHTFMQLKIFELMLEYTRALQFTVDTLKPGRETKSLASRLLQTKKLIDENEGKPLRIEQLARKAAMNSKELKEGFKNMFHTTIGQYQLHHRMEMATELLLSTTESIEDIAERIGYEDRSSFTRKFKILYKMTPLKYRTRFMK